MLEIIHKIHKPNPKVPDGDNILDEVIVRMSAKDWYILQQLQDKCYSPYPIFQDQEHVDIEKVTHTIRGIRHYKESLFMLLLSIEKEANQEGKPSAEKNIPLSGAQ